MTMPRRFYLVAVALWAVPACGPSDTSVPPTIAKAVSGRPGLSDAERANFYHLDEGSEVFPVEWFLALEREDGKGLFAANLDRFGLIPDARSDRNPYGLPIGLTAADTRDLKQFGVKMLGVNCAACHVAELEFNGNKMRLDGAPARFDTSGFFRALASSVLRTIDISKGPEPLLAFMQRRAAGRNPLLAAGEATRAARMQPALPSLQSEAPTAEFDQAFKDRLAALLRAEEGRDAVDVNTNVILDPSSPRLPAAAARARDELTSDLGLSRLMRAVPSPSPASSEMLSAGESSELRRSILPAFVKDAITTFRLLKARVAFLVRLNAIDNAKDVSPGFGRIDAFGGARNLLWPEGAQPQNAPVSYPDLWSFDGLTWVHWDGNTTSILERNIGQALGLGAVLDRSTMVSTVSVVNLHSLEVMAMKIQPPRWPEGVLGAIDRPRAARGKALFEEHCSQCHVANAGSAFDLDKIGGIDPARAVNFTVPIAGRANNDAISELLGQVKLKAFDEKRLTTAQRAELERGRPAEWRVQRKYIARPLVGIWASAPYLHNNSVPTLFDLLLPADKRPAVFFTGHNEYDALNVGLKSVDDGSGRFKFDTSIPGNRNTGHEFATALSESARRELLEYLKTF